MLLSFLKIYLYANLVGPTIQVFTPPLTVVTLGKSDLCPESWLSPLVEWGVGVCAVSLTGVLPSGNPLTGDGLHAVVFRGHQSQL